MLIKDEIHENSSVKIDIEHEESTYKVEKNVNNEFPDENIPLLEDPNDNNYMGFFYVLNSLSC